MCGKKTFNFNDTRVAVAEDIMHSFDKEKEEGDVDSYVFSSWRKKFMQILRRGKNRYYYYFAIG